MNKITQIGVRNVSVKNLHESKEEKKCFCPYCDAGPLACTGMTISTEKESEDVDRKPEPEDGSPSICFSCGELLIYRKIKDFLIVDKPSQEEFCEWRSDPNLWFVLSRMQKSVKNRLDRT